MNTSRNSRVLSVVALVLFAFLSVQLSQRLSADTTTDALQGIKIMPHDAVVSAGASTRLTAEGNYGTTTMPVRADWYVTEGKTLGTLENCTNSKTCTFTAGNTPGTAVVQAQIGDGDFLDTARVLIEETLVNPFSDELPEWAFASIVGLHKEGIINGYDDGRYGPGDPVTNGQIIVLLTRIFTAMNLVEEPVGCAAYEDIPADHYAYAAACLFRNQGWSANEPHLNPNAPAPRGAVAGYVNAAVGQTLLSARGTRPDLGTQYFDDVPHDHEHYEDTAVTNHTDVMTGYPSGDFGVDDDLNRAAVAVIIDRIRTAIREHGVAVLQGYDPSRVLRQSAPALPITACVIQAENTGTPTAEDPLIGDGFAKRDFMEDMDLTELRKRCNDAVFEELMESYCSQGDNHTRRVQWGVTKYGQWGGGAASGSQYHSCPKDGGNNAMSQETSAACVYTGERGNSSPTRDLPDVGDGYSKRVIRESLDLAGIRARCTDSVYEEMMEDYCAYGTNSDHRFQWGVLLYDDNGVVQSGGSAASGSNYHECPTHAAPEPVSNNIPVGQTQEIAFDFGQSGFDFSAGEKRRPRTINKNDADFYVSSITQHTGRVTLSVMLYAPDYDLQEKQGIYEFAMIYSDPFNSVTRADCEAKLQERTYTDRVTVTSNVVCVRTPDGYIVKVSEAPGASPDDRRIEYVLWNDPTYDPNTSASAAADNNLPLVSAAMPADALDAGVMELSESDTQAFWSYWGIGDGMWKSFQYRNGTQVEIERVTPSRVELQWSALSDTKILQHQGSSPFDSIALADCQKTIEDDVHGAGRLVYVEDGVTLCVQSYDKKHIVKIGDLRNISDGQESTVNLRYVLWEQ